MKLTIQSSLGRIRSAMTSPPAQGTRGRSERPPGVRSRPCPWWSAAVFTAAFTAAFAAGTSTTVGADLPSEGKYAWYDAATLSHLPAGAEVTCWTNAAGEASLDLQRDPSKEAPVYLPPEGEGIASVRFGHFTPLTTQTGFGLTGDPPFTSFFVGRIITLPGITCQLWSWGDGGSASHAAGLEIDSLSGTRLDLATGYAYDATTPNGCFASSMEKLVLITLRREPGPLGSTTRFYLDGAPLPVQGPPGALSVVDTPLGVGPNAYGANSPVMEVAELLFYDRALTDDELRQAHAHFAEKYFGGVEPVPSALDLGGLRAWYTAESFAASPEGASVTIWPNSADLLTLPLISKGTAPLVGSTAFEGKPAVAISPQTPMSSLGNLEIVGDAEFTVFFMGRVTYLTSGRFHVWSWGDGVHYAGGAANLELDGGDGPWRIDLATGAHWDAVTPQGSFAEFVGEPVLVAMRKMPGPMAATTTIILNGVSLPVSGSMEAPNLVDTPFAIGPPEYGAMAPWMDVAELVVYDRALSDIEIDRVQGYLNARYFGSAPAVDAGGPYFVDEGGAVVLAAVVSEPDAGDAVVRWDLDGDGVFEIEGREVVFSAAGIDGPAVVVVQAAAEDPHGALGPASEATVTVENVAPSLGEISVAQAVVQAGAPVRAAATLSDPGLLDTHSALWVWGDGAATTGLVTQGPGEASIEGEHAYGAPGVYVLELAVQDDDGGLGSSCYSYIVVYDPSAGFVTGGGWFVSPPGAFPEEPSLTGKATFGFVSKYLKKEPVPSGQTQFHFGLADLTFQSTSYEWLVVAGAKAMYKGQGVVNDVPGYGFLVSAIDGDLTSGAGSDRFRIKIWDVSQDVVVYDNEIGTGDDEVPTTTLGGGSIVIHKK